MLLLTVSTADQKRDFRATELRFKHMLYFNTLVLLKTKTQLISNTDSSTFNMVKIIGIERNLDEIHGCLCFSTEANISGGGELP